MSVHAFLDETKLGGLLIVTDVAEPSVLAASRTAMRELCLPGQARSHVTKERPARRREIAAAICRLPLVLTVYDATRLPDQRQARQACLRQVVVDLAVLGAQRLVLEQDDSLPSHDQGVLYDAVRRAGVADTLSYVHLPARSEPLLCVAEAAASCWSHGPLWQQRVAPNVRQVKRL